MLNLLFYAYLILCSVTTKRSIKYQPYPKSGKVDASAQNICIIMSFTLVQR